MGDVEGMMTAELWCWLALVWLLVGALVAPLLFGTTPKHGVETDEDA